MKKALTQPRNLLMLAVWLAVLAVILLVPGRLNNYHLTIVNITLIYFLSAMSISLMLGMGGIMSLTSVTFMGLSAFLTAQFSKNFGLPTLLALVLAMAATGVVAYLLSIMLVRLTGFYFVFGTIGLCNMMATVFQNFKPLTNGADGIAGIPKLNLFGFRFTQLSDWCLLLAAVCLLVALVVERIRGSSFGRSLMSIRDNPIAAQSLGVNVLRTKRLAFTLGAVLAALAGSLLAFHNGVVSASLFTFNVQLDMLMMVMLGGVNSTVGTLAGAFLVQLMPEMLRPIQEYLRLVQGLLLIVLMIFMPMGITGMVKTVWRGLKGIFVKKEKGGEPVGDYSER